MACAPIAARSPRLAAALAAVLWALAVALVPPPAAAETVRVLTGEHGGFTRLALVLAEASPWRFGRTARGYELRLERPGIRLDLTEAFRRIPRTRIAALESGEGRLALRLGCACHAVLFEDRPGLIVIDVRDGPAPAGSPFEAVLDAPSGPAAGPRPAPRPARLPPAAAAAAGADALGPWWRPPDASGGAAPRPQASPPPGPPAADPGLEAAQEQLLRALARAAAQGTVDPLRPPAAAAGRPAARPGGLPPAADAPAAGPGLRAVSVIDRDLGAPPRLELTPEAGGCLPDAALDLAAWGDGSPPAAQIAAARRGLVGEFDRPDPAAVGRLARLYLHLGFGAEARATLAAFGGPDPEAALLADLAAVLDDRTPPGGHLVGMAGCPTAAALWSVLAGPLPARAEAIDRAAVRRAFSALPAHLRRALGLPLAERFLALGDAETARALRDAILRAPGEPGGAADRLAAELELAAGRGAAAEARLARLAEGGGRDAPEALARLIETRLARGESVDETLSARAAALAHEHRGTALGGRLEAAHARAEAARGAFGAAFAAADRLAARDADAGAAVRRDLLGTLAETGEDADFLHHAFARPGLGLPAAGPGSLADPPGAAARRALARRFAALGFGAEALAVLGPEAGNAAEDRLLRARAALAADNPRAALRALAGRTEAAAAQLRAEALTRIGDHGGAARAYAEAGLAAEAARAAWRAGDWAALRGRGDEPRAALLDRLLGAPGAETVPEGELAAARRLLEDSARSREAIAGLLALAALPPDEGAAP